MSEQPVSNVMHERSIITYLVHRPDALYTYGDVLQQVRYDYPPAQAIFSLIIEAWGRYKQVPTREEMASLVKRAAVGRNWPEVVADQILQEVDLIYEGDATDISGEFISHFVVAKESEKLVEDLTRSSPDRLLKDIPYHIDKLEELQLLGARESELGIFPFSESVLNNMETYIEELYGGCPLPFGIGRLDDRMRGGLRPGEMGIIAASTGVGKQHPRDTNVLTPQGWMQIGSLRVGDYVIGSDGSSTKVTGIHPQGVKDNYWVEFSDHSRVEAGDDHLWTVGFKQINSSKKHVNTKYIVLTTKQLRERPVIEYLRCDGLHTVKKDLSTVPLYLPMLSAPVKFSPQDSLPISPYLMGALLANGGLTYGVKLSVNRKDADEIAFRLTTDKVQFCRRDYPTVTEFGISGIRGILRRLGLACPSRDKFIPRLYMSASPQDRQALLHGMMDGDGSISPTGNRVSYYTTSKQLAYDIRELVEGLGGIASLSAYDRSHHDKPTEYKVRLRLPRWVTPFSNLRKAGAYKPGRCAGPCRTVKSITYSRTVESVCITVDAPDSLYLTEHCIITHNSLYLLNVGLHLTNTLGKRVIYYAFDNTQAEMLERMYAITSRRSISEPDEGNVRRQHVYAHIGSPHERFLLKDYPPNSITTTDLIRHVKKVKNMLRVRDMKAGVPEEEAGKLDYVIVDYGDLIRAGRSFKEYRLELKDVFEELTSLAKRENIPVLTATQGNRESLSKETVTLKELAESFAKAWPASFVATLCQTQAERKMGQMRLAVVKARRPDCNYVVPLLVDYKTMRLADNEDVEIRGIDDASPQGYSSPSQPRQSAKVTDDTIQALRRTTRKIHTEKG